jgi:hypothetical protein
MEEAQVRAGTNIVLIMSVSHSLQSTGINEAQPSSVGFRIFAIRINLFGRRQLRIAMATSWYENEQGSINAQ